MRIKKIIRNSISYVTLLFLIFGLTSCGSLEKAKEMADNAKEKYDEKVQENEEEKNENCIKNLEEKADYYYQSSDNGIHNALYYQICEYKGDRELQQ